MRKARMLLLIAVWMTGCVSWPHAGPPTAAPIPSREHAGIPPGPITADEVNPANAHQIADAIWDEMDREQLKEQMPAASKEVNKR